jgi:hypothetical protein
MNIELIGVKARVGRPLQISNWSNSNEKKTNRLKGKQSYGQCVDDVTMTASRTGER